jgi:SAM-dependent methyltransferase
MTPRDRLVTFLKPRGKLAFLRSLPPRARVLDVGCGNDSPREAKRLRPDLIYHGLDVADYNQSEPPHAYADVYRLATPAQFASALGEFRDMDAVVSSHNIEHCDDPPAVLAAMAHALAPGGRLYLAFPCEASARFPHRQGTLNFFDDPTHQHLPRWDGMVASLRAAGLEFDDMRQRYRPPLLAAIGLGLEPVSALTRRNIEGATWALYGFESLVWARKPRE